MIEQQFIMTYTSVHNLICLDIKKKTTYTVETNTKLSVSLLYRPVLCLPVAIDGFMAKS